jgi:hypothetical protein
LLKRAFDAFVVSLLLQIIFSACAYKDSSYGDFEHIIVFADSLIYTHVRPELEQIFDQYVYTPVAEKSFYLELKPLQNLNNFKKYRNLMFIGILDGKDNVSEYISKALGAEVQNEIRDGKIFQIFREDLFAKEQMNIFLTSVDLITLKQNLISTGDAIYKTLEEFYFDRLERLMFVKGEQKIIEDYIAEKLGWRIRVQHDYHVAKESQDGNFVWLRRLNPDRSLFVYRFSADSMVQQESNWLMDIRDSLTTIYFEGDSISKNDTYTVHTQFHGQPALKLVGVWQNHNLYIGGPFRTYAFYDSEQKYTYVIDILVTAPTRRKKPYLDQLEVMANSFQLLPARLSM